MTRRITSARSLIAIALPVALLLTACGGGGDAPAAPAAPAPPGALPPPTPPAPATASIRVPGDTARPGGVLRVVLAGGGAPAAAAGTLGAAAVQVARENDSTMVGLVPDLAAASHQLRLTLGARVGTTDVSVRPAPAVADPIAAVYAAVDAMTARFAAAAPPAGFTATEWSRQRAVADSVGRDLKTRMVAASAAERLAVARLLASADAPAAVAWAPWGGWGARAPDASADPTRSAILAPPVLTARCASAITAAASPVQLAYVGLGAVLGGVAFGPAGAALLGAAGAVIYFQRMPDAVATVAALPEACYVAEGVTARTLGAEALESGRATALELLERARALAGAEARQGATAAVTAGVDALHSIVAALPASVAGAISKLPTRLSSLPVLPASPRALDAARVRVVGVTPSTVTATVGAAGGGATLTATTTAAAAVQFTATLSHLDDPTLQATVSGTVRPATPVVVTVTPATGTIVGLQTTLRLTASVTGAQDTAVRWTSGDESIATVASDGTVLGRAPGPVVIRATSVADPSTSATATITVTSGIAISLSPTAATVAIGDTRRLAATLTGTNSTGVIWTSANPAVATVTAAGDVTGLSAGVTTVRATAAYDLTVSATATITVQAGAVTVSVSPASATLEVGQSRTFVATVTGGAVPSVVWSTSSSAVARVDGFTGLVTAVAAGSATITARSVADPTRTATAAVTVTAAGGTGATPTRLTSGVPVSSLSGAEDSMRYYVVTVPTGATRLVVTTSGGSGDVDLVLRRGALPGASGNDCVSEGDTNAETCTVTNPAAGEWYVLLAAFEAYQGVTLTATVTGPGGPTTPPPTGGGVVLLDRENLEGSRGSQLVFTLQMPAGYTRLEITLERSLGDLYVRRGAAAVIDPIRSTTAYTADCASFESNYDTERCVFTAPSGTYYITVFGYHAYDGSRLRAVAYR